MTGSEKRKASAGTGGSPLQKNSKSAKESAPKEVNDPVHWNATDLQDQLKMVLGLFKEKLDGCTSSDNNRASMQTMLDFMNLQQKMNDMIVDKIVLNC